MSSNTIENWKQANAIYADLVDLSPSEALSALQKLDSSVSEEVRQLIITLIGSGAVSSQFVDEQVGGVFDSVEFTGGDLVGGYVLDECLGQGGMATVFAARREGDSVQKPVAIKLFNRSVFSQVMLSRIEAEQQILASLSHPNVVNLHHSGRSDSGIPFMVMELIEGASDIDHYVKSKELNSKQVVQLVLSAAQAVAYAHQNLIVHRDLKPSNLLVDANGEIKVVDFGIAKMLSPESDQQKTTILALTPSFAAPEQINSGLISVATDVFSLAAVCLSLLTRDLPLPKDRLLKSCVDDEAHIWKSLRKHIEDKDLRNVLNKALQQDPQKRYHTMDAFATDLQAWLRREPVLATPDSWWYRIRKFAQRRSALFAALSTLVAMMLLSIMVLSWQVQKTQAEANKANAVKNFMLNVFNTINPEQTLGERIYAKDLLVQAAEEIQYTEFSGPETQETLLNAIGQAQSQLGLLQGAKQSFTSSLALNPDSITGRMGLARTELQMGELAAAGQIISALKSEHDANDPEWLLLTANFAKQESDYPKAIELVENAQRAYVMANDLKGELRSGRLLADVQMLSSESKLAIEQLEKLVKKGLTELSPASPLILGIRNDLVNLYNDVGEYDKALEQADTLTEQVKRVMGDQHPSLVEVYIQQAGTQRGKGDLEQAKTLVDQAFELAKNTYGMRHEATARAKNMQAIILYTNGQTEAGLVAMYEGAQLYEQALGAENPETWQVKTNLGAMLMAQKKHLKAIEIIEPLVAKQQEVMGAEHKSTIYSQNILVRLYAAVGRLQEGHELGKKLMVTSKKVLGSEHPLTAGSYVTMSQILQQQGDLYQAIELLLKVVGIQERTPNEGTVSVYDSLANLYMENKQPDLATKYKQKSVDLAWELLGGNSPRALQQTLTVARHYLVVNKLKQANRLVAKVREQMVVNNLDLPAIEAELNSIQQALDEQD